jgi:hypothetical protein
MIPRTYHDGNPEDWNYVPDFWKWLKDQPQDVWLLWARNANWDNAEWIFEQMVASPACDRAVAAWLFWSSDPAYYVRNPCDYSTSLAARIVEKAANGLYVRSELFLDRLDTAHGALSLLEALEEEGNAPFALPRSLLGPFNGRRALSPAYDDETRLDLDDFFHAMDGGIDTDEAAYAAKRVVDRAVVMRLKLPAYPVANAAFKDDAEAIKAFYGSTEAYKAARSRGAVKSNDPYRELRYLAVFGVAAIGGAIIARYLKTGGF